MGKLIEVSKEELNGKTIWDYVFDIYRGKKDWDGSNRKWEVLEMNMTKSEHPHYKHSFEIEYSNGESMSVFVEMISDEDFKMNKIIRKSFYRCYYGMKLNIDSRPIIEKIGEYLEKEKVTKLTHSNFYIMNEINHHIHRNRFNMMEMLGY
tara:strand:+ start:837 stop:1286 length:450 start_codon:yes stop_codon:yes gene_type:complete